MVSVGSCPLLVKVDRVLDVFHLLVRLLSFDLAIHFDLSDFGICFGSDLGSGTVRFSLLLCDFLSLDSDLESSFLGLNLLVVLHQVVWDLGLGHS